MNEFIQDFILDDRLLYASLGCKNWLDMFNKKKPTHASEYVPNKTIKNSFTTYFFLFIIFTQ